MHVQIVSSGTNSGRICTLRILAGLRPNADQCGSGGNTNGSTEQVAKRRQALGRSADLIGQ